VPSGDVQHFHVNDQRIVMRPGEGWHVDGRFPHEVHNAGTHPRVHLVLDLVGNAETDALLAGAESSGQGRLTAYFFGQLRKVGPDEG
jgi:aspartyl/asparaginyl beta-hydroxylase